MYNNEKKSVLCFFTTFVIIISPFICFYKGIYSSLTVLDCFILPLSFVLMINLIKKHKFKIEFFSLILAFLIFTHCLYVLLNIPNLSIFPALRLVCYFIFLALALKEYFNQDIAKKIYKITAIISSVFLIIQEFLFKIFGIFISGTIPFLTPANEYIIEYNQNMLIGGLNDAYNRPRSFFGEPSHFAIYVALYLAIELLTNDKPNYIICLIIIISLLLSGSGTAILLSAIIMILYLLKKLKKFQFKAFKKYVILIFAFGLLLVPLAINYIRSEPFQIFFRRTFVQKDSTNGRFGNYIEIFTEKKNTIRLLFGDGVDNDGEYISTIPKVYKSFGIVGFIIFIILNIYLIKILDSDGKMLYIVLVSLFFATEIAFGARIMIYMSFILENTINNKKHKVLKIS